MLYIVVYILFGLLEEILINLIVRKVKAGLVLYNCYMGRKKRKKKGKVKKMSAGVDILEQFFGELLIDRTFVDIEKEKRALEGATNSNN